MSPDYLKKWIAYLDDVDRELSRLACEKLGKAKDPAAVPELLKALRNRPVEVRAAAARALGEIGDRSAIPALVKALDDQESLVSSAAADALGVLRDASAVPALTQVLHNYKVGSNRYQQMHGQKRGVYMAAVHALEHIGTREAKAAIAKYHRW